MKKKLFNVIMTGALAAGVLGTASLPALAATSNVLDTETKAKVDTIMENLQTKLTDLGVQFPEKRSPFANLDADVKAKAEAIWEKQKAGTITEAEAKTQLEALGVTFPERGMGKGAGHLKADVASANLSEANQTKAEAILEKVKAGTITHDEAEEQLAALGVTVTEGGKGYRGKMFEGMDEEIKEEAETLIEEAKEQIEDLGVENVKGLNMQ